MKSVTGKFISFINNKIDGYGKALSVDQMFQLQAAERQVAEADVIDYITAKRNSTTVTANKEDWQYNKVGADLAEFISDVVEFLLAVGLSYCVRTAEQRVRAIWRSLPPSWQVQPIYDTLFRYKERSDENLRSNLEIAMKNAKSNPSAFLECCLKSDSGAINRRKDEAAARAAAEAQLRQAETEQFKARIDSEFEALKAEPDYESRFAECVAWYKNRYPKSADFIDGCPQAINGYLINLKERGHYEAFRYDNDQSADQTQDLDAALLDNE